MFILTNPRPEAQQLRAIAERRNAGVTFESTPITMIRPVRGPVLQRGE